MINNSSKKTNITKKDKDNKDSSKIINLINININQNYDISNKNQKDKDKEIENEKEKEKEKKEENNNEKEIKFNTQATSSLTNNISKYKIINNLKNKIKLR
jgi:hypothetical protein